MARVPQITGKSDVATSGQHVVDQVMDVFGRVRGPFSILLHSPKLAELLLPMVTFNRNDSVVEAPLRSIAVLAAVREREAAYVWAAQVDAARRAGVQETVIDLFALSRRSRFPAGGCARYRHLHAPAYAHQSRG